MALLCNILIFAEKEMTISASKKSRKCFFNGLLYVHDVSKQKKIGEKQNMKNENRCT